MFQTQMKQVTFNHFQFVPLNTVFLMTICLFWHTVFESVFPCKENKEKCFDLLSFIFWCSGQPTQRITTMSTVLDQLTFHFNHQFHVWAHSFNIAFFCSAERIITPITVIFQNFAQIQETSISTKLSQSHLNSDIVSFLIKPIFLSCQHKGHHGSHLMWCFCPPSRNIGVLSAQNWKINNFSNMSPDQEKTVHIHLMAWSWCQVMNQNQSHCSDNLWVFWASNFKPHF